MFYVALCLVLCCVATIVACLYVLWSCVVFHVVLCAVLCCCVVLCRAVVLCCAVPCCEQKRVVLLYLTVALHALSPPLSENGILPFICSKNFLKLKCVS